MDAERDRGRVDGRLRLRLLLSLLALAAACSHCGSGGSSPEADGDSPRDAEPDQDAESPDDVASDESEEAAAEDADTAEGGTDCGPPPHDPQPELCAGEPPEGVRVDEWIVDVPPPPANPVTSDTTPPELNRVRVLRYRQDPPVDEVDAVIVFLPGFLAGATSVDPLARRIVLQAPGPVEIWSLDKRENFLEDLFGMEAAEAARDPEIAHAYYFESAEVDGRRYAPVPPQSELGYMSEWGLVSFIDDLRTVLDAVPPERQATNLFLAGHSMGASLTEVAMAWDIGGVALSSRVAGIVLIDGSISGIGIDRTTYHAGITEDPFPVPGVDAIRDGTGDRLSSLFGADPMLLAAAEISAMRAYWEPARIICHDPVGDFLALLYDFRPWMTNAALFGFAFDETYSPMPVFAASVGEAAGGGFSTIDLPFFGFPFEAPADPEAVYHWVDLPGQLSCIRSLARSLFAGPSNFLEWAFPARLDLDERTVHDLAVSAAGGDYRYDEEGFLVTRASEVDVPVLAIAADNRWEPGADTLYEPFRTVIAPVARNGATRDEDAGFRVLILEGWTHLDPIVAEQDEPAASIIEFVEANRAGTVSLAGVGE